MTRDEILACVRDVLRREFGLSVDATVPSARLQEDLDLDSLDAVALAVQLEEETGVLLEQERLEQLRTVQDVVEFVFEQQEPRRG
jgi:acyl carrier protein